MPPGGGVPSADANFCEGTGSMTIALAVGSRKALNTWLNAKALVLI
jgi:hypothetical protein